MTAGHSLAVPVQSVPEFNSSSATSSESISSVSPSVDDIQSTDYNTDNASENCMWPNALQVFSIDILIFFYTSQLDTNYTFCMSKITFETR